MEEEVKALQVRFPLDMYERLAKGAKKSRRSLNAEIIFCLEGFFKMTDELAYAKENVSPERLAGLERTARMMEDFLEYVKANPDKYPDL